MRVGSDAGALLRIACFPWPPPLSPPLSPPPPQAVRRARAAAAATAVRMDIVPEIRMCPIVPLRRGPGARGIGVFRPLAGKPVEIRTREAPAFHVSLPSRPPPLTQERHAH